MTQENTAGFNPETQQLGEEQRDIDIISQIMPNATLINRLGGETNKNYRVWDGTSYIVRVPRPNDMINRDIEQQNLSILLESSIGRVLPAYEMYFYQGRNIFGAGKNDSIPNGVAVTREIGGLGLSTTLLRDSRIQESLARAMKAVHTSGVQLINPYDPFSDEIETYKGLVEPGSLPSVMTADTTKLVDEMTEYYKGQLPKVDESVVCHNDPVYGNFMVDASGAMRVLDWEYAGRNSRGLYYDLGAFYAENAFEGDPIDQNLFAQFLAVASREYGIALDPKKVYAAAITNMLVTLWFGAAQYAGAATEEDKSYFDSYVSDRLQKIRALAA